MAATPDDVAPAAADDAPASTATPVAMPSPTGEQLSCSFHWRKSDAHSHAARKEVKLTERGAKFSLRDFDFEVSLDANVSGGKAMKVEAKAGGSLIASSYDFGPYAAAAHLPAGGHGFSGLRYLTHPTSGSEVQFYCGAGDPKARGEFDSQASPGPGAPKGARLHCEAAAFDGDAETGRERFRVASSREHVLEDLGGFSFSVRHMTSETEGHAVIIDASDGPLGDYPIVHTLYQLREGNLPSNTLADPSFTGLQSIASGSGARLEYRCWTEA